MSSGDLWLYAPTRLTEALQAEIDALGPLRHIVVPTPSHLEPVRDWWAVYPHAQLWAPGEVTREALSGIPTCPEVLLLQPDKAEAAWETDLRQVVVQGNPDHQEAVFFHRSSDTLVMADLISAVETTHLSPWLRPVIWLMGLDDAVGRVPRWLRRGVKDDKAFADSLEMMVNWGPRRILMRHGRWYRRNGVMELERAFRKILRERQWEKALQQMQDNER